MSGLHFWKEVDQDSMYALRRRLFIMFTCEICGETILAKTKPEPGFSREHWGPAFHPIPMGCNEVLARRVHES